MSSNLSRPAVWRTRYCQSCGLNATTRRTFSSSPVNLQVGPESPTFIDVPQPPQQRASYLPPIKGILPTPRRVFGPRNKPSDKATPEYLNAVTPLPTTDPNALPLDETSRLAWKARMAEARRRNLRQGVRELYTRQERTERFRNERARQVQAERQRQTSLPQREDERLTNPSVLSSLIASSGIVSDPDREARLQLKRDAVARREQAKSEQRQDSLHTLYMRARDFITTEAGLDRAIEQAFGTIDYPVRFGERNGQNIWAQGRPASVQDMLDRVNKTGSRALDNSGHAALTRERIKALAEELTGGKI